MPSTYRSASRALIRRLPIALAFVLPAAHAQVAPSTTGGLTFPGFQLPEVGGSLTYALSASESVTAGVYNSGDPYPSTSASGDVAYISASKTHPFSAIYSGALLSGYNGKSTPTVVQNLGLSQVLITQGWQFVLSDVVSYLPQTPTTGLSGVPGIGDLGVDPVLNGPITGQGILSNNAPQVTNSILGSVSRRITPKMSVQGSAIYSILRFPGSSSASGLLNSDQFVTAANTSYAINGRNSVSGGYTFSRVNYVGGVTPSSFNVQGVNGGYSRQWNRWLSTQTVLGPQWIKSSAASLGGRTNTELSADAVALLQSRVYSGNVTYVRGANNGFGIVPGNFSDSVNGSIRRSFGLGYSGAATVNYTRSSSLSAISPATFSARTFVAGVQANRSLRRSLSFFLSYNVEHQSSEGAIAAYNTFRGLSQTVAVGLTYASRPHVFGPP